MVSPDLTFVLSTSLWPLDDVFVYHMTTICLVCPLSGQFLFVRSGSVVGAPLTVGVQPL